MKKRFGGLYPLQAIILGFLILIGILVGTFADLPIEQAIYHSHTNWYSQFIEFFGSLPPAALLGSGAVFFFLYFQDQKEPEEPFLVCLPASLRSDGICRSRLGI
jgi:hypothetical protein